MLKKITGPGYYKNFTKEQCVQEIKEREIKTPKECKQGAEGLFKRIKELYGNDNSNYNHLFPNARKTPQPMTTERLIEIMKECKQLKDMKGTHAYDVLCRHPDKESLKAMYFPDRRVYREAYTLEEFVALAKKYETRGKWIEMEPVSYSIWNKKAKSRFTPEEIAQVEDHLVYVRQFKGRVAKRTETLEEVMAVAKKYKHITDWNTKENKLSAHANHKGWTKEVTAHMDKTQNTLEVDVLQPQILKLVKYNYPKLIVEMFSTKLATELNIEVTKGNRPDILVYNPKTKKFIFLEIKKDVVHPNTKEFNRNQLIRYQADAKKNSNCKGVVVASPAGKAEGSIPFFKVPQVIKQLKVA